MEDNVEILGGIPLFATVSKRGLRALAKAAHDVTYEPGTRLASQDELGVTFFVVVEGEVDVVVDGQRRARLGPRDYFGEMSIIDRSPRSADVVAVSQVRCLVFTQWQFRPFLKDNPDVAWSMLEVLVRRLREVQRATGVEH